MQNRSDIGSDTAWLPSDHAGLVEELRTWGAPKRGNARKLMRRAAEAIAALSRATEAVACAHNCDEGGICLAELSGYPESCPGRAREAAGDFIIQERDDDMLIAEKCWQFGNRCIARRPALLSNDEWRPTAQRIVAALATPPAAPPALALIEDLQKALTDLRGLFDAGGSLFCSGEHQMRVIAQTDTALASAKRFKTGV